MIGMGEGIIDLAAPTRAHRQTVADRIKQRKIVLAQWLKEGIPIGKRRGLPSSLRAARDWNDPELGIVRIASPNEFSQKHPVHGADVREIARLLTEIAKRYAVPKVGPSNQRVPSATFDKREAERQLAKAVSQWHMERHARLSEQKRADAAERRARVVLQENAELRRMLSAHQGPTIVP